MIDQLFAEIAIVIITAGIFSLLAHLLKQPLIIAYIITGLVVGPNVLNFTDAPEMLEALSKIGIAFLLFLVGLNLNWRNIKDIGKIALIGGVGQVVFTTLIGYGIGQLLDLDILTSLFTATAFAFSSTIIIVKLLSDKRDIDRFYGRIATGFLIVQDLIAMALLLVLGTIGDSGSIVSSAILLALLKMLVVVVVLYGLAKTVLPYIFTYAAKSQELLFLTALTWCFAIASTLHFLGFGIEVGALLAGLSLAGSPFHREVESKIRPLRDFFLILFFVTLGTHLSVESASTLIVPSIVLSLFVLIGNPLIVVVLMRLFGYHPRTGFLVGTTVAQISEFSFIFLAAGISLGFVDSDAMSLATIVGLTTIAGSTYLTIYNEQIYQFLEPAFRLFERAPDKDRVRPKEASKIILIGYEKLGEAILPTIEKLKKSFLVVDFDPSALKSLEARQVPYEYGDAGNEDFLSYIRLEKAETIISTVPDVAVSRDLLLYCFAKRSKASIIVTAKNTHEAKALYEQGATFVIVPSMLSGELFKDLLVKRKTRASWSALAKKQKQKIGV